MSAITPAIDENEHEDAITDLDRDPGNLCVRAGYLRGLAAVATAEGRLFLLRASRSLLAYAIARTKEQERERSEQACNCDRGPWPEHEPSCASRRVVKEAR